MYTNQQQQKAAKRQHSPIGVVSNNSTTKNNKAGGSNGSNKIVPSQLSRAFLSQRQNQTPNPQSQQQALYPGAKVQANTNI